MDTVQTDAAASGASRFYFIAWRWHFYAGLYVIPFLLMLACTGLVMLWVSATTELNGERTHVTPGTALLPVSRLQAAAEAAVPGSTAVQYIAPMGSDRVAAFAVSLDKVKSGVTLNPFSGEVVETFPWGGGWYNLANEIHGTLLIGNTGDWLIEAAASLGIVMLATGLYLHWPRGARGWGTALVPQLTARGRARWKSLHGAAGLWVSVLMLFFLVSGLSWTGIWGTKLVQAWSTFPTEKWDNVPLSDATHAAMNHGTGKEVPWALEQTPLPASGSLAGLTAITGPVTIDAVADFADSLRFDRRYQINLPMGDAGVWTVSHDSMSNDGPNPAADRTIHIDRFTGNVLADVRFADYSPYAKAMAWGIAIHEGDLGNWNLALNTLFCLSMIFLPVSGVVMWWKRRPEKAGRLAAPPKAHDAGLWKGAAVLVAVLGVLFPLAGAAILVVLMLDATVLRLLPTLKRALS